MLILYFVKIGSTHYPPVFVRDKMISRTKLIFQRLHTMGG